MLDRNEFSVSHQKNIVPSTISRELDSMTSKPLIKVSQSTFSTTASASQSHSFGVLISAVDVKIIVI